MFAPSHQELIANTIRHTPGPAAHAPDIVAIDTQVNAAVATLQAQQTAERRRYGLAEARDLVSAGLRTVLTKFCDRARIRLR